MANTSRTTQLEWKAVSTVAGIAGAMGTRKLTSALWSAFSSSDAEPPLNPADRRIAWGEAVRWAIAAGVGAALGRLVSQRLAAAGWEAATGDPPPGVKT